MGCRSWAGVRVGGLAAVRGPAGVTQGHADTSTTSMTTSAVSGQRQAAVLAFSEVGLFSPQHRYFPLNPE